MFPDPNFVDYIIILFGVLLCFKKVAQIERHHELRILIITSILSAIVLLFWFGLTFGERIYNDCPSPEHFCLTEM